MWLKVAVGLGINILNILSEWIDTEIVVLNYGWYCNIIILHGCYNEFLDMSRKFNALMHICWVVNIAAQFLTSLLMYMMFLSWYMYVRMVFISCPFRNLCSLRMYEWWCVDSEMNLVWCLVFILAVVQGSFDPSFLFLNCFRTTLGWLHMAWQ